MKRFLVLFIVLITIVGLCACAKEKPNDTPTPSNTETEDINGKDPTPKDPIKKEDSFDAITKIADFVDDGKNLLYSPLSLNFALAIVSEGASDEIKADFEEYFGLPFNEYIEFYKRYIEDSSDKVEIANAFWTNSGWTLKQDFKDSIIQNFKAETGTYDFNDEFVDMVNQWCAEKTHDMIQNILDSAPDCDAMAVNALYFKGMWAKEYDEDSIREKDFTLFDKTKVKSNFLISSEDIYLENDKATGFMKFYDGDRYAFVGILPKDEGNFTLSGLDIGSLLKNKSQEDVYVRIPEFEFEAGYELTDSIAEVGLESTLDADKSPFPDITEQAPMKIAKIIQKTKIKLNKDGTEAAAVTVVEVDGITAVLEEPKETKEVYLNRPFAFLIYDAQTDTVLFIGKVVNPLEG